MKSEKLIVINMEKSRKLVPNLRSKTVNSINDIRKMTEDSIKPTFNKNIMDGWVESAE
jgi:hypothetical protein